MKRIYTLATFIFSCAVVFGTDMTVTNTAPESGDRTPNFEIKNTKSLSDLQKALAGFGTNLLQVSGTISGTVTSSTNVNVTNTVATTANVTNTVGINVASMGGVPINTNNLADCSITNMQTMFATNVLPVLYAAATQNYVLGYQTNQIFPSGKTSGTLLSFRVVASTNGGMQIFNFSRPLTAPVTNGAAWVSDPADLQYVLHTPIVLTSADYTPAGTNYVGGKSVNYPIRSTDTTRNIYTVYTSGSGTVSNYVGGTNYTTIFTGISD